jgi:hypothetical protein
MNKGLLILKWTVVALFCIGLFGWVTMFLWNYVVPPLFNGPEITFFQALGLLLLSKILLTGLGGGHHRGDHSRWHWKRKIHDKFSRMTPEEREHFKARMREKWGCRDKNASSAESGTSNV